MAYKPSTGVFGGDLDAHLLDQQAKLGTDQLPYVLSGCEPFLRTALATPGLFRTDVEPDELSALRARIEASYSGRRKLDLGPLTRNWHAAAGLVKAYLRELPRPLLSHELYPYFLQCGDGGGNAMTKLGQLADLLGRLPPSHLRSFALVLALLHDTSVVNAVMTAAELAKIFAPLLLRPAAGANALHDDRVKAETALALMISNGKPDGALLSSVVTSPPASSSVDGLGRQMAGVSVSAPGALPATTQWYYIDAQQNYVGPVDTDGLRQLKLHKYVNDDTYVWAEQLSSWQRLSSLPDFQEAAAAPPVMPPVPTPAEPTAPAANLPAAPSNRLGSSSVACGSAAAPVMQSSRAVTTSSAGGVAAPPSLGLAVQRKRQATNEAAPINLTSAAMRPTGTSTAAPSAPLGRSTAPSLASGVPPTPLPSVPSVPDAAAAAAVPAIPRGAPPVQQGISIPTPKMVPLSRGEEPWSSAKGLRLLATGAGQSQVRALIKDDGEVADGAGTVLAYIEQNGEVGDAQMNFVGKALERAGQVVDAEDAMVGEFDRGRGYVKDGQGSVVAEISKEGNITNNGGQGVGSIDGFSYDVLPTLAAYFLLVDPAFLRTSRGYGAKH